MPARKNLDEAAILAAVLTGERYVAVAQRFGCTRPRVSQIARKHGYDGQAADLERRAMKRAGVEAKPVIPKRIGRPPKLEMVPFWADEVADDYLDHLQAFDEFVAARHCRALLQERRRVESIDARLGRAA
ncbi:hypothetical protein [Methylorubrum extorquens]|uniref:hypothetical protein n=1 Tax=Methylorubrum extorquens TaxID=408 RepID=UPI0022372A07|nr:hypothetical protein [Methylorubrum extorquens]UYW34433.1 hypothetical protein OKB92_10245 [Methylorubrum extorquens]